MKFDSWNAPIGWKLAPVKRIARICPGATRPDVDGQGPVPLFGANGVIGSAQRGNLLTTSVVIGRVGTAGAINLVEPPAWVSDNALIGEPAPSVDARYLWRLLGVLDLPADASKTAQPLITQSQVANRIVPIPPLETQRKIASFLDAETERIDQLVAVKTRMIGLLAERFESLLCEQLQGHPSVPLKRAIEYREGPGIMAADFRELGVPLVRVAGVTGERVTLDGCNFLDPEKVSQRWSHFRLEPGDFVISASATMGTVALVDGEAAGAVPYTGLIRIRPGDLDPDMEYIRYFLQSRDFMKQIDLMKTGTAIQHYGPSHLDQVLVPLPSKAEQREIAAALRAAALRRSEASAALRRQVDLLDERRRSLITAAVTGEMEVP